VPPTVEQLAGSMPFFELIGAELVEASAAEVRGRLAWDESRCTAGGLLHGGALMALADGCGGVCAYLNLPEGAAATATIESKTNFLGAVRSGTVHARSTPLHAGRRTVVVDTELRDDEGRLVARVTQTQAVL
jgi:1,4-dihydroxy-2-naphthoyl-CoA hydrolase